MIKNRRVRLTFINDQYVSTVFLGMGTFRPPKENLFFETMVFPECSYSTKCSNWRSALNMHWKAVEIVKREQNKIK